MPPKKKKKKTKTKEKPKKKKKVEEQEEEEEEEEEEEPKKKKKKKGKKTDVSKSLGEMGNIGKDAFWTPKEGKNTIRILPPWNEDGVFFFKGVLHYGLKTEGNRPIPCRVMDDKDCPICEKINEISDKGLTRRTSARTRFYVNVLDRDNEEAGIKIWGLSAKQMKSLRSYMEDPDYGDFTDPEEGRDVIVDKDSSGTMASYEIRMRPKSSELDYDDWEDELHMLDEEVVPELPSLSEYKEIVKASFSKKSKKEEEEEEEEDDDE